MEAKKIKRDVFVKGLNALALVSEKGNLEFDEWLRLEKFRVQLEDMKEQEAKIFQRMADKIGYTEYSKKVKGLMLKNQKNYTHTEAEIKMLEEYEKYVKDFSESLLEIPEFKIAKSILAELPEEVLSARKDLLPIVSFESNTDSEVVEKPKKK